MIIDSHQHPHDTVITEMEELGFDRSVLLPVGDNTFPKVVSLLQEYPDKFIPFFWINMGDIGRSLKRLEEAVRAYGVKGIKFQPLIQHFRHNEKRLYPVYEKCVELDLVCTFHTGMVAFYQEFDIYHLSKYTHPMALDDVAYDFPELKIIIAHMGGNYNYEALLLGEKHEHIYFDTAYLPFFCERMLPVVTPQELIERAVKIVGPERVLYGYEGFKPDELDHCNLRSEVKEQIMGGNAAALFDLTP